MDVAQRTRRAATGLIENESLTAHLDDEAAQALLEWGTDCAKRIAADTAGMADDEAEEAMYGRMRALRKMLRRIDRWMPDRRTASTAVHALFLAQIAELAGVVYGTEAPAMQADQQAAFARGSLGDAPVEVIGALRQLVEQGETGA